MTDKTERRAPSVLTERFIKQKGLNIAHLEKFGVGITKRGSKK